jgi:diacylglycerol kinase family enzyme
VTADSRNPIMAAAERRKQRGWGILPQAVHGASRLMPLRFQKIEPRMDTDGHRFLRNHTCRSAPPAYEANSLRKSSFISVHQRPSAVKIS